MSSRLAAIVAALVVAAPPTASAQVSPGEITLEQARRIRQIGPVSVRYLGPEREPIPNELLDRLAPIP